MCKISELHQVKVVLVQDNATWLCRIIIMRPYLYTKKAIHFYLLFFFGRFFFFLFLSFRSQHIFFFEDRWIKVILEDSMRKRQNQKRFFLFAPYALCVGCLKVLFHESPTLYQLLYCMDSCKGSGDKTSCRPL